LAGEPSRQERVSACLREIAQQPDFPSFSVHIQQVMQVLEDQEASLRRLTSLVLRDYSLTLRVLRTANSARYNRSGRPILSVSHAVVLLGAEAIRHLAGSLALFEHFHKRSPGLKELMLLSLLTANQNRAAAAQIRYPRSEEAYLCGMFCNLGEVLIACYFPRPYALILSLIQDQNLSTREACLRVLQFTYDDLGQAVAQYWNMPDQVKSCIQDLEAKPPKRALAHRGLLGMLTSFSHALTTAVYRRDPEGARSRVNLLIKAYLPLLRLHREDVSRILDTALLDTKNTFSLLRVPLDNLRLTRQTQAATAGAAEAAAADSGPDLEQLTSGPNLLEQLTHEVEILLEAPGEFHLNNVLMMILEAIYRGGHFDRVLFCLINPAHTYIQGRLALGEGADGLRDSFCFPLSSCGGPIGAALRMKQELFLPEAGVAGSAEQETLRVLGAASFGLLPVLVDNVLVGGLYFDRLGAEAPTDARTARRLSKLRDLTGAAIKRSRCATPA